MSAVSRSDGLFYDNIPECMRGEDLLKLKHNEVEELTAKDDHK